MSNDDIPDRRRLRPTAIKWGAVAFMLWLVLLAFLPPQPRWSAKVPWDTEVLAIHPASNAVLTYSQGPVFGDLHVYDLESGELRLALDNAASRGRGVGHTVTYALSGDGSRWAGVRPVVQGQYIVDAEMIVVEMEQGKLIFQRKASELLVGIPDWVGDVSAGAVGDYTVQLDETGQRVALFGWHSTEHRFSIQVLDVATGQFLYRESLSHRGQSPDSAISHDGQYLVMSGFIEANDDANDRWTQVWRRIELASGRTTQVYRPRGGELRRLLLVEEAGVVVGTSRGDSEDELNTRDGGLVTQVFDLATGQELYALPGETILEADPTGRFLLLTNKDWSPGSDIESTMVRGTFGGQEIARELSTRKYASFLAATLSEAHPIITAEIRDWEHNEPWVRFSRSRGQVELRDHRTRERLLVAVGSRGVSSPDGRTYCLVTSYWLRDWIDKGLQLIDRWWPNAQQTQLLSAYDVPAGRPWTIAAMWAAGLTLAAGIFLLAVAGAWRAWRWLIA